MNGSAVNLECPFTWHIDPELVRDYNENEEPGVDADEQPDVLALMKTIMITYFRTEKKDFHGARQNIQATFELWDQFRNGLMENNAVSSRVLYHIMMATEYHFYKSINNSTVASKIYKELEGSSAVFERNVEKATINGCKSLAWTSFHERGWKKAARYARKATAESPNCALWHYILAKNLRYSRRLCSDDYKVSAEEKMEWEKSYELSKMPFYGIHLAEMYRSEMYISKDDESREKNRRKARDYYSKIFAMKPSNVNINLRLTHGFTTLRDFTKAKTCLDFVEAKGANGSMFWHYKGIFLEKLRKLEEAAACLEKAVNDTKNFRADLQYANVKFKLDRQFDRIEYFESMIVKYDDDAEYKQQLLLHIGMQYKAKNAAGKALGYFLRAIELDPKSNVLTKFVNSTLNEWKPRNIYDEIVQIHLPAYYRRNSNPPETERKVCQRLEALCQQHTPEKAADSIAESLAKVKIS